MSNLLNDLKLVEATKLLPDRPLSSLEYDSKNGVYKAIKECFKKTIPEFIAKHQGEVIDIEESPNYFLVEPMPRYDSDIPAKLGIRIGELPYGGKAYDDENPSLEGSTTLEEKGSAALCFYQALGVQGQDVGLVSLIKEISSKGYVHSPNGTYHALFDNYALPRVMSAEDIVKFLRLDNFLTLLVDEIPSVGNKRCFVNLFGVRNGNAVLYIPGKSLNETIPFVDILKATDVAWAWKY